MTAPGPAATGVARPDPALRALPVQVALVGGEAQSSLLWRLARANHLDPQDLLGLLPPGRRSDRAPVDLQALAALTGHPLEHLRRALPLCHRWCRERWDACTRCLATRGIYQRVEVRRFAHQGVCRRHRRWLLCDRRVVAQPDLRVASEILSAHRRHVAMAGRDGHHLIGAWRTAQHVMNRWTARHYWSEQRLRRLQCFVDLRRDPIEVGHPLVLMANYPETVRLAGLLADPGWNARLARRDPGALDRFAAEVRRRLRIDYEPYFARDPLLAWATTRPTVADRTALPVDTDTLFRAVETKRNNETK